MWRQLAATLAILLTVAITGCSGNQAVSPAGPVQPEVPPEPGPVVVEPVVPPAPPPAKLPEPAPGPAPEPSPGPRVVAEGKDLRILGTGEFRALHWAPGGEIALLQTDSGLFALRPDAAELRLLASWQSDWFVGWAGPDAALMMRWERDRHEVGALSLETGAWRPLASLVGRAQVQICQNGPDWLWVDVQMVRQGGAGSREIGAVYRTPADLISAWAKSEGTDPLSGDLVMERGAILGRLADGSCLLDAMDQRLLLARPTGELQTLTDRFTLPEITADGRGVLWREEAGECPECIEIGPGVPFQRLVWWRLDGERLTADVGSPRVLSPLLSPDGQRLVIGHLAYDRADGAIGVLGDAGFDRGQVRAPALVPVGWLGETLLAAPAGPERWRDRSPILRAEDGAKVGEQLAVGFDGSLLIDMGGESWYLGAGGASLRVRDLEGEVQLLGEYQPQAPYVVVRHGGQIRLLAAAGRPTR
jgi:hypothetical protein